MSEVLLLAVAGFWIPFYIPGIYVCDKRGLNRGGLTPACGVAHARDGRGCRPIEAVNGTVLPRGALRTFHG